jgi:ubiquinone/menaquinone biosynthesis C-methylase UbiE
VAKLRLHGHGFIAVIGPRNKYKRERDHLYSWGCLRGTLLQHPSKRLTIFGKGKHMAIKPGSDEYAEHVAQEIAEFSRLYEGQEAKELLVEPCPEVWTKLEGRMYALQAERTGRTRTDHITSLLNVPGERRRLLSLGSGPGGVELEIAGLCPEASIHGIDLNPQLLKLGEERARSEQLSVTFEEGDLNTVVLPRNTYDVVFCHASLHHLIELEHVARQIQQTLKAGGRLIVEDVIMRNGSLMWPETKEIVTRIWQTLPGKYRVNHTAYDKKRIDDQFWELDTSTAGMECIRSQDVKPVLEAHFKPIHSITYMSLCMRFFHLMYGPNYDLAQPFDAAFFEYIWQLDALLVAAGKLRGEVLFGVYRV